jgi:hypothetical protein
MPTALDRMTQMVPAHPSDGLVSFVLRPHISQPLSARSIPLQGRFVATNRQQPMPIRIETISLAIRTGTVKETRSERGDSMWLCRFALLAGDDIKIAQPWKRLPTVIRHLLRNGDFFNLTDSLVLSFQNNCENS